MSTLVFPCASNGFIHFGGSSLRSLYKAFSCNFLRIDFNLPQVPEKWLTARKAQKLRQPLQVGQDFRVDHHSEPHGREDRKEPESSSVGEAGELLEL
jgi:hypothetical protein